MASCFVAPLTRAVRPLGDDLQSGTDARDVALARVGVRGLRHPVPVRFRDGTVSAPVAEWSLSVRLAAERRGTHMSRMVECVRDVAAPLAPADWPALLADLRRRLEADDAELTARFPLPLSRRAPVSGLVATAVYDVWFRTGGPAGRERLTVGVRAPLTTVCPCSKAISDYGAHNQRTLVLLEVSPRKGPDGRFAAPWPEELVDAAEAAGSAAVFPLLKRPDERAVTMRAFDRPAFVEDVARTLVARWRADGRTARVLAEAESLESIHAHNAFAAGEWTLDE